MKLLDRIFGASSRRSGALEAASPLRRWGVPFEGGVRNTSALAGLTNVVRKSQHAAANNPYMANGVASWVSALIGTGIVPASGVADQAARTSIHSDYNRWVDLASMEGTTDAYGVQSEVARALVVDGESFVLLITTAAGLRLRVLPAEAVPVELTRELGGGARIVAGVEFDTSGRRVAYHVRPDIGVSPFVSVAPPIRIPAEDVCHVMRPLFPGQVRGVPWGASVLVALNELDQLLDALQVAAKTSAMLMGFITDENATGPNPFGEGVQIGDTLTGGLEPGTLKFLPQGWSIKFSSPQQANSAMDLAKLTLRSVAAGLGVPEYLVSGDLSQANYSSLRAGLVEFRRRVEQVQHHVLIPQFLRPAWRRWLTLEIVSGRIEAPGFEADPDSWLGVDHYPPPMPWVDPIKDAEAEAVMIGAGLKSRRQSVAERGYNIEALDAEIAADRAREKTLGLDFSETIAVAPKVTAKGPVP